MFRRELPVKFPPNDDLAGDGFGVENVTFWLNYEPALGFEIFGGGVVDVVIVQIQITAALLAHGGLGAGGNIQFRAALEANDPPQIQRARDFFLRRVESFLNVEMPATLFAIG